MPSGNVVKITFIVAACLLITRSYAGIDTSFIKLEGVLSNTVYNCFQDANGYMWLSTEAGVSRYDGTNFLHFTRDNGLSDNEVFQVCEDHLHRFWLLTNNGQPTIIQGKNILTRDNAPFLKRIRPDGIAMSFVQSANNAIWYVSNNAAYEINDTTIRQMVEPETLFLQPDIFIGAVLLNKQVWLITSLGIYNVQTREKILFGNRITNPLRVKIVAEQTKLYLSADNLLLSWDIYQKKFERVAELESPILNVQHKQGDSILIISTRYGIYNWSIFHKRLTAKKVPAATWFTSYMTDAEGNSWVTSLSGGVYFLPNPLLAKLRRIQYRSASGNQKVYALNTIDKRLYVGYDNGEYLIIEKDKIIARKSQQTLSRRRVHQFYKDGNTIWIAAGNLMIEQDINGVIKKEYPADIKAIELVSNGFYLAFSSGLYYISRDSLRSYLTNIYKVFNQPSLFPERVHELVKQNDDSLWLGTVQGLRLLVHNRLTGFGCQEQKIMNTYVSRIARHANGMLAFTTLGSGLGILWNGSCYTIDRTMGLSSNNCNTLYFTSDTSLLVGTDKGIDILTYHRGVVHITSLNHQLGIRSQPVNELIQQDSVLWIAMDNGLYAYHYAEIYPEKPPTVHIENLLVNDSIYQLQSPHVILPYDHNNIEVHFVGISYHSLGQVTYQFRLKGLQKHWQKSTQPFASFSYLPPGFYEFQLMAASKDFTWSNEMQRIFITIRPPFWKTIWFITLVAVCITFLFFQILRYVLNNVRKQHLLEQQRLILQRHQAQKEAEKLFYDQQLAELEHKALRLQMNPHFVFNAVTAIQGLYALGDVKMAKSYIAIFSRLLRNVFEIAPQSYIPVSREIEMLTDYIELTIRRTTYQITYAIETNIPGQENNYGITPMLIQPFVENALIHGLLPARRAGHLLVRIEKKEDWLYCVIQDNGIGRQPKQDKRDHTGLSVTFKRIAMINHTTPDETYRIVSDLSDESGMPKGTLVEFKTKCISLY